jgi:ferritin-like protein
VLVNVERCAVKGCTEIWNMTAGKGHRTHELAFDLTPLDIALVAG